MSLNTIKKIVLGLLIIVPSFSSMAQKTLTGKVTAFNKYPLKNIEVETKKSKQLVKTDSDGTYSISITDKDKIQFRANGFYSTTLKVSNEDTINVNLIYIDDKKSYNAVIQNGNNRS